MSENNLLKQQKIVPETPIYDITPFSMLDYPEHLSCIIWFSGCNMRCDYCYNPDIVLSKGTKTTESLLDFLRCRIGKLEAVVLSGGEPTQYSKLIKLAMQIKTLGFKIKLDTNGTHPKKLRELIQLKLLDYVALDYKAPKEKFSEITKNINFSDFQESLKFLLTCKIDYEVRTTLHYDLLDEDDINAIIEDLVDKGYQKDYYIQKFKTDIQTLGDIKNPIKSFDKRRLSKNLNTIFR